MKNNIRSYRNREAGQKKVENSNPDFLSLNVLFNEAVNC
jgi:hypothetical protein